MSGVEFQTLLLFKNHVFSFFCLRYHSSAIIKNMAYLGVPIIQDVCISYAMLVIKCFFFCSVKPLVFGTVLLSNMMWPDDGKIRKAYDAFSWIIRIEKSLGGVTRIPTLAALSLPFFF